MATKQTFDEVGAGAAEDVVSVITRISRGADENHVVNTVGVGGKATARLHQWLSDSIRDAAENAQKEKYVVNTDVTPSQKARVRLVNQVQTMADAFELTDSVASQDLYAVANEVVYQRQVHMLQMANDKEYSFVNGVVQVADATTPGKLDGLLASCNGLNIRGQAMDDTNAELRAKQVHDDGATTINTAMVDTMTNRARKNGRRITDILLPFDLAEKWSSLFEQNRRLTNMQDEITSVIMIYKNVHGAVKLIPHLQMAAETLFGYDPSLLKESVYRAFRMYTIGKTGSFETFVMDEEITLEHRQPDTYQKYLNVTT